MITEPHLSKLNKEWEEWVASVAWAEWEVCPEVLISVNYSEWQDKAKECPEEWVEWTIFSQCFQVCKAVAAVAEAVEVVDEEVVDSLVSPIWEEVDVEVQQLSRLICDLKSYPGCS